MKKHIIALIFVACGLLTYCQVNKGIVYYQASMVGLDTTKVKQETPEQRKTYNDVMNIANAVNKLKLELNFKKSESFFLVSNNLINSEDELTYKLARTISNTRSNFYFSSQNQNLIEEKESFGELFLISKEVKINDWMLLSETKMIGEYLCYKATRSIELINRHGIPFIRKQEVWFTPDIPLPFGPKEFVGFPGLVLLVKENKTQYLATKIVLNPQKEIEINKPTKGKKVTEEEYKEISTKSINNTKSIFGIK